MTLATWFLAAKAASPPEMGAHSLWEFVEENAAITYPFIILAVVGLIGGALVMSWRAQELSADKRGELKHEILKLLRKRVSGTSAESIAAEMQLDMHLVALLLNEMKQEGMVTEILSDRANEPVRFRMKLTH